MLTITLTGPESTGKTTLAAQLAGHFHTVWVPEFARSYLNELGRPYQQSDLLEIASGQVALEEDFRLKANELLFLDTSLEVVKIWSEFRYGSCHPWILEQWQQRRHDLYLLCLPDVPWAFDPQRENPGDREVLLEIYRRELTTLGVSYFELSGLGVGRFHTAVKVVEIFLTRNVLK
jgi:NadR type nicotinamide-nucleotide adenylyltransferase